jgi:glycerol kinase
MLTIHKAIRGKIRNKKHATKKQMAKNLGLGLQPPKAALSKNAKPKGPLDTIDSAAFLTMRRAAIMLKGDFTARDLFIYNEEDLIDDEIERQKSAGTTLVGGALFNHVVKDLWTDEKQQEYAPKVDPTPADIAQCVVALFPRRT